MSESGSRKFLAVAVIWLVIAGLAAATYKYFRSRSAAKTLAEVVRQYDQLAHEAAQYKVTAQAIPADADTATATRMMEELRQQVEQARLIVATSPPPRAGQPEYVVKLALDSFSGYCVLRSSEFQNELSQRGIQLELVDDKADYAARLKGLQSGQTPVAAFTVDALIKHSAALGTLPATIIMVIDETRGADAMVAYKQAVPNLDALNRDDARVVLTRDSPSETLARVVQADFNLPNLKQSQWVEARDAADVYRRFRDAVVGQPQAFVLWEPYVTKVLENPAAHVVVDSGKFKGIIVDVLVADRSFLNSHPDRATAILQAYLTALFYHQQSAKGLAGLVQSDAKVLGESLTDPQAERLVQGIWWKNTLENFAHFGVKSGSESQGLQHVDDMIRKITDVLTKTGAIPRDPTDGSPNKLYFDSPLAQLSRDSFHPRLAGGSARESIRKELELPALGDDEWTQLLPVGTLQVDPVGFVTGSAELLDPGRAALSQLVSSLRTWPQYYLQIHGRARPEGDAEANRQLARERAQAVQQYLTELGVPAARMKTEASIEGAGALERGQSVTFRLLQRPY